MYDPLTVAAGAAAYVITAEERKIWKQVIFVLISFIGGVFFAVPMAKIMAGIINTALVAASISVAVLLRILSRTKRGKGCGAGGERAMTLQPLMLDANAAVCMGICLFSPPDLLHFTFF
jgi:hypothetical protein